MFAFITLFGVYMAQHWIPLYEIGWDKVIGFHFQYFRHQNNVL